MAQTKLSHKINNGFGSYFQNTLEAINKTSRYSISFDDIINKAQMGIVVPFIFIK